ncbi:hypothetical protein K0651_06195 [Ornithinimicrobium sp. Arc0846-15]|nr:hypothetical protein [Ornithinimicrobium laminariae]
MDQSINPLRLLGDWTFERIVVDQAANIRGTVVGTMSLQQHPDGHVDWREIGVLLWNGQQHDIHRELRIVPGEEGAWEVTFDDGRPFHPWLPGEFVDHPCRADRYQGSIDIDSDQDPITQWFVSWTVRGPQKDHRYETKIRRAADV